MDLSLGSLGVLSRADGLGPGGYAALMWAAVCVLVVVGLVGVGLIALLVWGATKSRS